VLAELELDVVVAPLLTVSRDSVVRLVTDEIGLVVSHDETFRDQSLPQRQSQSRIAVIQNSSLPDAPLALEDRGEAVHCDEDRRLSHAPSTFELGFDTRMVRVEDACSPLVPFCSRQLEVAGDLRVFTYCSYRAGGFRRPIAVDDESRVRLQD